MSGLADMHGQRSAGPNPINPAHLSAGERRAALCAILARGLVRLKLRQSSEQSAGSRESSLHFPPDRSGHAKPTQEEAA